MEPDDADSLAGADGQTDVIEYLLMVLFKIAEGYVLKFNTAACNFPVGKRGIFIRQINGCLQNFCDTLVRGSCTRTLQNNGSQENSVPSGSARDR